MKRFLIIVFLFISVISYSQESEQKKIINTYTDKLKLNANETKKLASIMASYKTQLHQKDIDNRQFNATLKLQTLEIYELLRKERFLSYLKLRSKYQPELNYRYN